MATPPGVPRPHRPRSSPRPLRPGGQAPAFALHVTTHQYVALQDYQDQRLVLVFYVADWHPVCTAQLGLYQEMLSAFGRLGAAVVAISPDSLWSHAAFARSLRLGFPLLTDRPPPGATARRYGIPGRSRGLFVVDERGLIRWSDVSPETVNPGADGILTTLEQLAIQDGRPQ